MPDNALDYLVIGAGPAGLQLGYFSEKAGRSYLILGGGPHAGHVLPRPSPPPPADLDQQGATPGPTTRSSTSGWTGTRCSPTTRRCCSPATADRYFPHADDMVRYLADFAAALRRPDHYDARVARIGRDGDGFTVRRPTSARLDAEADGCRRDRRLPALHPADPGHRDRRALRHRRRRPGRTSPNQRVLVIGKGNSAFETADDLVETAAVIHVAGPNSVRMAWQTHFVGHLRAVNNNFLDTYQLKSQNAVLDGTVKRIEQQADGGYLVTLRFARADEVDQGLPYDRVIVCTGFRFDASIFDDGCRSGADDQRPVPGADPRLRVGQRARPLLRRHAHPAARLQARHQRVHPRLPVRHARAAPHPGAPVPRRPVAGRELAADAGGDRRRRCSNGSTAPRRCGSSSACWPTSSSPTASGARYLEEVPVAYLREGPPIGDAGHFAITLEYGPDHDKVDPFDIAVGRIRQSDAARAHEGHYLHPVVRHHRAGAPAAVHHITENLENDWTSPEVHLAPLRAFFARQAASVPA